MDPRDSSSAATTQTGPTALAHSAGFFRTIGIKEASVLLCPRYRPAK